MDMNPGLVSAERPSENAEKTITGSVPHETCRGEKPLAFVSEPQNDLD